MKIASDDFILCHGALISAAGNGGFDPLCKIIANVLVGLRAIGKGRIIELHNG